MSTFPHCCQTNSLYVGLDAQCTKTALICTVHATHPNPSGIMHNIMPITHFKSVVNQLKFQMSDKVAGLVDKYNGFMDELIAHISELKCRKSIQLSTLWVRELAKTEEEYEQFKKIFRNDIQGFSCRQIYNFYDKMLRGVDIRQKKLQNIECYKEIESVLDKLATSAKARMMIVQKVADLQGVIQSGELLKKALPDRKVLMENTKEILLESHIQLGIQIRYNRAVLKKGGNNYRSVFSKYPLLPNTNYHLSVKTKYGNVLIGFCEQKVKSLGNSMDLHYNTSSLTYNCSNGCIYRDAMFESGSAHLTKSKKDLDLILRINDTQMLILLGKNVVCRAPLRQFSKKSLFLHMLMRTEGDSFQIDSDKVATFEQKQPLPAQNESIVEQIDQSTMKQVILPPSLTIDKMIQQKGFSSKQSIKREGSRQEITGNAQGRLILNKGKTGGQYHSSGDIDFPKKIISGKFEKEIPKDRAEGSLYFASPENSLRLGTAPRDSKEQRSKVLIQIDTSLYNSNNGQNERKLTKRYTKPQIMDSIKIPSDDKKLIHPTVIAPIRRSQFDQELERMPSLNFIPKQVSGLDYVPQGLVGSQLDSDFD